MDFFASQELARRKTRLMIALLVSAIIGLVISVYLLFLALASFVENNGHPLERVVWFRPELAAIASLGVLAIVSLGSLFKIMQLRGGGSTVAAMLGAKRILPSSSDLDEKKLLNVVEEMAIASGTPVPPVYLLDHEQSINAFAAGYTVNDAIIGVNRGTIQQLNRDELQGVIAHEFSHILNGDMRMSIRMIGLLHGIQLLALIGYFILRTMSRSGSSNDKKGGQAFILALGGGLWLIGSVGLLFARLIKASVSRHREYLADASAVQFTRNPDGIGGALKMIGASSAGSAVTAPNAEQLSHMYFANMFGSRFSGLMSTHPPLVKRIRKIDPQFDGKFAEFVKIRKRRYEARAAEDAQAPASASRQRFPGMPTGGMRIPGISDRFPIDPAILVAGIGLPDHHGVEFSHAVSRDLPALIDRAIREVFSARCVALAMLVTDHPVIAREQLTLIRRRLGQPTADETEFLKPQIDKLPPASRLPILAVLQGTLSGMSDDQYQKYRATLEELATGDNQMDLFEFILQHHLIVHLDRRFGAPPPPRAAPSADQVAQDLAQVLSLLVDVGHREPDGAQAAFAAAWRTAVPNGPERPLIAIDQRRDLSNISQALLRLADTTPNTKRAIVRAAATAIAHDQRITAEEAELFRAIAETLDCPVPPVVTKLLDSTPAADPNQNS